MQFQRAQPNVVRSIRHVSLIKDWTRARRGDSLPHFSDFVPDERSGDAMDIVVGEVRRHGESISVYCRSAGARVEQIFGRPLAGHYFRDILSPDVAAASRLVWHASVTYRLPMCSILSLIDSEGCPVTLEQVYLPYRSGEAGLEIVVSAVHALSTEGRFAIKGLMADLETAPPRTTVIIDPDMAGASGLNDEIEVT